MFWKVTKIGPRSGVKTGITPGGGSDEIDNGCNGKDVIIEGWDIEGCGG